MTLHLFAAFILSSHDDFRDWLFAGVAPAESLSKWGWAKAFKITIRELTSIAPSYAFLGN
jgi:hypothetical protein